MNIFKILTLLLCLVSPFILSSNIVGAESMNNVQVEKSVKNNGITFTMDSYSIKDNKMIVNYTIKTDAILEKRGMEVIQIPDVSIDGKKLSWAKVAGPHSYKKVNEKTYICKSEIDLPTNLEKNFTLEFKTETILDQTGEWKINFEA